MQLIENHSPSHGLPPSPLLPSQPPGCASFFHYGALRKETCRWWEVGERRWLFSGNFTPFPPGAGSFLKSILSEDITPSKRWRRLRSTLIFIDYCSIVHISHENSYWQPSRLGRNRLPGTTGSHPSSKIASPWDAAKLIARSLLVVQRLMLMTCYAKASLPGENLVPPSAAHTVPAAFHPRSGCMSDSGHVHSSLSSMPRLSSMQGITEMQDRIWAMTSRVHGIIFHCAEGEIGMQNIFLSWISLFNKTRTEVCLCLQI